MYGIFFRAGEFLFVDPDEFTPPEAKTWKACFDGTAALATLGATVKLDGAPMASWVLARLASMTESTQFPKGSIRRESELGGFRIRVLAVRGTQAIAKVHFGAECGEAELMITAKDQETAAEVARALIARLGADPDSLDDIQVDVKAQELEGLRNIYGYDGVRLLGHGNVYE